MSKPQTILVTGGAGYVGGILIPKLLAKGHTVKVLDLYIYGESVFDGVRPNPKLTEIKGDIRDLDVVAKAVEGCETVIHLACISNDPSADLDPALTKTINLDCFPGMIDACKAAGVKRFFFASSSSVYGISDELRVTEDHARLPVTDYNRYKAMCEDILAEKAGDGFTYTVIRPATVCGWSPRLRLDLTVNILTAHALNRKEITVFGGEQYRPNLHVQDMTDLYVRMLDAPIEKIAGKIWNAGYQNMQVKDIAQRVKAVVEEMTGQPGSITIKTTPSNDIRSYRITCDRIEQDFDFKPKHTIEDAVRELVEAFQSGKVPDPQSSTMYVNIARMKEIGMV